MADPDVDALVAAVRESVTAVRPGDVLAVRLPMGTSARELDAARRYARAVEEETGLKVAFIRGEEFQHTTVNVAVNGFTGGKDDLAGEIGEAVRKEAFRHARRNGGPRWR